MAGLRAEFGTVHATVGTAGWGERYIAAQAQAEALFTLVRPDGYWKASIDAVVPADTDLNDLAYAIEHFTATAPTFLPVEDGWRVLATGYAAGPAGDH